MSSRGWADVRVDAFKFAWKSCILVTDKDLVTMFEEAYKQQPNNEDLAINTFFANARTGNWKVGQQVRFWATFLRFFRTLSDCHKNA